MIFHILDEQQSKFQVFHKHDYHKSYNDYFLKKAVEKVLEEEELLHLNYKHVRLSIAGGHSTLVPNKLYDARKKRELLGFNYQLMDTDVIRADELSSIGSKLIYAIDKDLLALFDDKFPKANLYHAATPLIESLMKDPKVRVQDSLFVNILPSKMDLVHIQNGKFGFYNQFSFNSEEDLIFHILFVCEQLNLNPEKIRVVLLGEVMEKSRVQQVVYKYIRNVEFGQRPAAFNYSSIMAELPVHRYYDAFSLNVCE